MQEYQENVMASSSSMKEEQERQKTNLKRQKYCSYTGQLQEFLLIASPNT